MGLLVSLCALFSLPVNSQVTSSAPAPAQSRIRSPDEVYDFDIPRTSRFQALHELSRQAGSLLLGYLANDDQEAQALVGPVKGKLTVEAALQVILRSSMLTSRWVEQTMVSVEPIRVEESAELEDELMLAAAVPGWSEEVTVVSWPLRDLTLSLAPVVVVERERIDAIGAPTLSEALRYISQSAYTRPEGYRTSGAQYAEMRGLGPDTALILINGRRTLPSANSITSSAFDLNTIPITAVERIEFLLDSGATPYGTDAIGGIINIVLRRNVSDPTLDFRYGAADGGAEQRRVTFSTGIDWPRLDLALILDYFDLGDLQGSERALWRDQNYQRFGGRDQRSRISNGGNISSVNGGNLPGLSSPIAAVPLEDATPGVSTEDFVATAGTSNLESLFKYWTVVPEATRASVASTGSFAFNERLTASAEVLYVNRDAKFHFFPSALPGVLVPESNAYNPFGTAVIASRLVPELDRPYQYVESDLWRAVAALQGEWGQWNWELSGLHSDEEATTWIQNEIDMSPQGALMAALASSDQTRALNPFQSGPVGSPELLNSLLAPRDIDKFASVGTQFSAYTEGPIKQLPAGAMRAMAGGEWRRESASFASHQCTFDEVRHISSAFTQLRVPVIGAGMHVPAIHELSLSAGIRWDDYDDVDRGTRSQFGLQWKPHPSFTVRASRGRSFRPPSLYELYLPEINTLARISDPARNHEPANIQLVVGGNRELRPVTARTLTAGLQFSADTAMNWKLSADYWRITMNDRVWLLPAPLLLAHEDLFAERIVRAEATEADVQAGRPGELRSVDISRLNVGRVRASGVDIAIRSDFQTSAGRFMPELIATWFDEYLATDVPGEPTMDRVNVASELGTILKWRAILSLGWKRGPFAMMTAARYSPSYDDAVAGMRVGRKVAAQTLFDVQGSLDFSRWLGTSSPWAGVKLSTGAINLFDEEPSFAEVGDVAGFDMSQGDLKQRSYYLRLEKKF